MSEENFFVSKYEGVEIFSKDSRQIYPHAGCVKSNPYTNEIVHLIFYIMVTFTKR